ncbi:hypothetical protein Rhal01_01666 [Rubritalea halochordaticola]|uniref:PhoP regulatory network protein YrbL n=1 Tax=Rubritalea halochordaticola TaxID=714537 RepID=A0ABP9UYG7_9BACT
MPRTLILKDTQPIAKGKSRLVFQHPDEPDLIIKVMRPEVIEDRFGAGTKWYKRRRRYGKYVSYIREIQEYIAVHAKHNDDLPFLQEIIGFAKTDLGLGLVLKAIQNQDGTLSPTLAMLIKEHRLDDTILQALSTCLDQLLNCDVIVSDINLGNLVYQERDGQPSRFILIDGIGNNTPLPFKAISRRINRKSKLGRFAKLYNRIERAKKANRHP